jgi:hypothetical protein
LCCFLQQGWQVCLPVPEAQRRDEHHLVILELLFSSIL